MRRRDFMTLVSGAAASWPLAARAQQSMPVIGFLNTQSADLFGYLVDSFRQGLREAGYVEGQNVAIEYRWAENHYDRLPVFAKELAQRPVAAIAATGGNASAFAAKAATAKIPIVFLLGDLDPVQAGLVISLNRPAGNMTGVSVLISALGAKRLELLHELVPKASNIGLFMNPTQVDADIQTKDVQEAGVRLGLSVHILKATNEEEVDAAFGSLAQRKIEALIITADPFLSSSRSQIVPLAARYGVPAIHPLRETPVAGGLMSYGPSLVDSYRQAGIYAAALLKGAKPGDLPVIQPSKFELVINLRTAKSLGLEIAPKLLVAANEVID